MISRFESLELHRLSAAERLELMEQIWASLQGSELESALSETQQTDLDHRIMDADAHPEAVTPWAELHAQLRAEQIA